MNNEEKILSLLEIIVDKVDKLEQGQSKLEQRQSKLEQGQTELLLEQTKIRFTIDHEIKRNIGLLVDGHMLLNEKLDNLISLNEQVIELKNDTAVHKVAIAEIYRKNAK